MISAQEIVLGITDLPSLPNVYFQVKAVVEDPNSSLKDLEKVVATDPSLTARLLKLVNSALFGFPAEVDKISRALNILGTRQVHDLVLATSVTSTFARLSPRLMDMDTFWRTSVLCGLIGRQLAALCNAPEQERIFVSALLSDSGHLVMYRQAPEQCAAALKLSRHTGMPLARVERLQIGCDYAEVGAELFRRWGLPKSIEAPVRFQTDPALAQEYALEASFINIARCMAQAAVMKEPIEEGTAFAEPAAWSHTKLNMKVCQTAFQMAQVEAAAVMAAIFPAYARAA